MADGNPLMIIFRPNSRLSPLLQLSFFLSNKHQTERTQRHISKRLLHLCHGRTRKLHSEWANGQETDIAYLAAWFQSRRPVRCLIGGPAIKDPGTKLSSLLYYFLPPTPPIKRAPRSTHQAWITHCLALYYTISERHSQSRPTAHLLDLPRSSLTAALAFSLWLFLFSSVFFPSFVHQLNRSNYFPVVLLNVKCLKFKSVPCRHGVRWMSRATALLVTFCT